MINYSIIIPHYNSPDLLERLINSIPNREDVQIIVVDDNSNADKRPTSHRDNVEIIYLGKDESKGAGRARNVGMKVAKGKWLLFADADDFYSEGFLNDLDTYKDRNDLEVLFFNTEGVDSDTLQSHPCSDRIKNILNNANKSKEAFDWMKYRTHAPWCKMVLRSYVERYGFVFDEVRKGNDIMFSYQVAYFTDKIELLNKPLYIHTYFSQGITHSLRSVNASLDLYVNYYKKKAFYEYIGYTKWEPIPSSSNAVVSVLKNQGVISFMRFLYLVTLKRHTVLKDKNKYIDIIEEIKKKI